MTHDSMTVVSSTRHLTKFRHQSKSIITRTVMSANGKFGGNESESVT